jgi:hypothetical protein
LLAEEKRISINDALAYILMRRKKIDENYTFDRYFENSSARLEYKSSPPVTRTLATALAILSNSTLA